MVYVGIAMLDGEGFVEFAGCEGHDGETEPFEGAFHGRPGVLRY